MNQKKINSINLNDIKKKIITFQITYKATKDYAKIQGKSPVFLIFFNMTD